MMALAISLFTLTSCEDVPMPYELPEQGGGNSDIVVEAQGDGTAENPYNVAGVLAYIGNLDADVESDKEVYVKGIVYTNSTTESTISQYGNMTFTMVDEGTTAPAFTAFQVYGPGKKKFTSVNQIQSGQEVVVCGKVVNYKGNTPETVGKGASYVVSINGEGTSTPDSGSTVDPKGKGTESDPFNVAAAIKKAQETGETETSTEYYIKGIVASNNTTQATIDQYGNMTFTMVDEGTSSPTFTAFQVYGPGKEKFTSADQIKEGQTVVVCGKIVNYKGNTPETVGKGASYVVSIDGEGTSTGGNTGGGDNPNAGTSEGVTISGTTVTLDNASATAGDEKITINLSTLGYTNAEDAKTITLEDGTTIVFDANGETNGPKYYDGTKGIRVYKNNTITFNGKATIAQVVMECDSYNGTDYVGNTTATVAFEGAKGVYTNAFTGTGGGVQLRVKTITITYAK